MIPFTTREQLIEWVSGNIPRQYKTAHRALQDGAELLGGFSRIPPSPWAGWIIKTTSRFGKVLFVALSANKMTGRYHIYEITEVPWEHWVGDRSNNPMYKGDNPEVYKNERDRKLHASIESTGTHKQTNRCD